MTRSRTRISAGATCLVLCLLALAPAAQAGPPTHLHEEALGIEGFNHACGTAVDSKGDVYVASAGEGKVRIFDPTHTELTSIANANEPCGLAVNSKGELFVSEQAAGKVVRYKPNAYPFSGTPTYGAREEIDASGDAEGIAVDRFDDRLYVAKATHIAAYRADGTLDLIDEVQQISVNSATGGTFELSFEGPETAPIAWNASAAELEAALKALPTIGTGNVTATKSGTTFSVTFTGALAASDVEALKADSSALEGGAGKGVSIAEQTKGFNGRIGEGALTEATGVAAFTTATGDRYLYAADGATDQLHVFSGPDLKRIEQRRTVTGVDHDRNPETPEQAFGFGPEGAHLAVDPGNRSADGKCASVAEQACTAGHLLLYDAAHDVVDELDASGEFLDQFTHEDLTDALPTGLAIERSGGPNDGTIYVTEGAGAGSKLLAFGPLAAPSRAPDGERSQVLEGARAVATDSYGNVYVAAGPLIKVYDNEGEEIEVGPEGDGIEDPNTPLHDLAVDSTGKVYVLEALPTSSVDDIVTYYTPSVYPPVDGTSYSRHSPPVATSAEFPTTSKALSGIAVDPGPAPRRDQVFVTSGSATRKYDSAANGSGLLDGEFGDGLTVGVKQSISVYGANGNVYFGANLRLISVVNSTGAEVVARTSGAGCPGGQLPPNPKVAVDQSNGHILTFEETDGKAREYDAAGACVAEFGEFSDDITRPDRIAINNSCALHEPPLTEATTPTCKSFDPSYGTAYVAFDDTDPNHPFDLTAFEPLTYGEAPVAATGVASAIEGTEARLNGTVNPRGFEATVCEFEYLSEEDYLENVADEDPSFQGAQEVNCAGTLAAIGKGKVPVPVHADVSGLQVAERYRFRLLAANKYGPGDEDEWLFGPPLLTTKTALPILYEEATLRAEVDPSGLPTTYRFQYGKEAGKYDQSTPATTLAPGDGPVAVQAPLTGLQEGTTYHFRIVVENEAEVLLGPDQSLETLQRRSPEACANAAFRTGLSANLPDCRAYELVTPAETNGLAPYAAGSGTAGTLPNNWLVTPRGPGAGDSLAYFTDGTLPGFDGNGRLDGYRAARGAGAHPPGGWSTELFGPSFEETAPVTLHFAKQEGVSPDQLYSFWKMEPEESFPGTFPEGIYLRTPAGFEVLGQGSLGTDLDTTSLFLSAAGAHAIFSSQARLEEGAAPQGTTAIYDRAAGAPAATVVSLKPGGLSFGTGEHATYLNATEDGSAVAFSVGGTLYVNDGGQITEVATSPSTFAGLSEDGERVFYAASSSGSAPATLHMCETGEGPCTGATPTGLSEIATAATFAHVSADGSQAFFTSGQVLSGAQENDAGQTAQPGEPNLYAWDAETGAVGFVARLSSLGELGNWTTAALGKEGGRADSPTRSTPGGEVFVFESHAQLSDYDNEGRAEIYRYAPAADPGERLLCVSCDPSGAPATGDDLLQDLFFSSGVQAETLIPNVTDDGQMVFFQSLDALLPEDANSVADVYRWRAQGGGCKRASGCLALISSGKGDGPSILYSMSADGRDVFFRTREKLAGADIAGSPSIYDARIGGGIPDPPAPEPCQGDACQGQGSPPPLLAAPDAPAPGDGNLKEARPRPRCPKGKRKVRRAGKVRCIKRAKRSPNRASRERGAGR